MSALFKKLNLKDQKEILVMNAPQSLADELAQLDGVHVRSNPGDIAQLGFALVFVTCQQELDKLSGELVAKAQGDALLWFAYPKKSSRRYSCDFNRDRGWDVIRSKGYDSVRMVAVDEDWSALRFRRVEYIGTN